MTKMIVSPGEQDRERDLVRRLLPLRAFDERDHAVEERLARIRADCVHDAVGEHARAAGDRRAVAAGFADDGRGLAGDRRLVDRRGAFDDLAVGRDQFVRLGDDAVAAAQLRRRRRALRAPSTQPARERVGLGAAQELGLRLAAAFGHRLGEVREQHGEPQPRRDREVERRLAVARVAEREEQRRRARRPRRRT